MIGGVKGLPAAASSTVGSPPIVLKLQLSRQPSLIGLPFVGPQDRRFSASSNNAPSPADIEGSWRSKVLPRPQTFASPIVPSQPTSTFVNLSADTPADNLASGTGEELQVIDFAELGNLVKADLAERNSSSKENIVSSPKLLRPVASDFFEETGDVTWRRKEQQQKSSEALKFPMETTSQPSTPTHLPPHPHSHRPLKPQYKEATISALDDAMSRIKGALNGMQAAEAQRDTKSECEPMPRSSTLTTKLVAKERWIPPALRPRAGETRSMDLNEAFETTGALPPRSPAPTSLRVSLPRKSAPKADISRRQLQLFAQPVTFRWDVLSFNPPVESMSHDLSVNEILFRKHPIGFKGKVKYRVILPKAKTVLVSAPGPKVNLPTQPKLNGFGVFGRQSIAVEAASWRKTIQIKEEEPAAAAEPELNTTSRSPPPVSLALTYEDKQNSGNSKQDMHGDRRYNHKTQLKLPGGPVLAIYQDHRADAVNVDIETSINFTNNGTEEGLKLINTSSPTTRQTSLISASQTPLSTGTKTSDTASGQGAQEPTPSDPPNEPFSVVRPQPTSEAVRD